MRRRTRSRSASAGSAFNSAAARATSHLRGIVPSIAIRTSSSARWSTPTFGAAVHRASASASRSQIGSCELSLFLPEGGSTPIETDEALLTSSRSPTEVASETGRDGSRPTSFGGIRLPAPPPDFLFESSNVRPAVGNRRRSARFSVGGASAAPPASTRRAAARARLGPALVRVVACSAQLRGRSDSAGEHAQLCRTVVCHHRIMHFERCHFSRSLRTLTSHPSDTGVDPKLRDARLLLTRTRR